MIDDPSVRTVSLALLRQWGLTTIFGNPGSTELPLFRDFPVDFRYVLGLQESIVVAMADGFAQATRNAALVNLHSAAGVGHALGNIFTAFKNQTPLIVTAGQQARSILPYEPFLFAQQAVEFPRPYVKWAIEPARAEDVPAALSHAYHIAMLPPRGPVFVSIPADDWDRPCAPFVGHEVAQAIAGDPALLARVGDSLAAAQRPVFVVGAGVARDDAWDEMIALAERHKAPVWVAPMSARNSFPEDHPLFAGFLIADRAKIVAALDGHDVVVILGGPASLYHVEGSGPHMPPSAAVWLLTDNPATAAWLPGGAAVITSMKSGIAALLAAPAPLMRAMPLPRVLRTVDPSRFDDRYVLSRLAALRAPGSIIVEEAPSSREPMHDHLPIPNRDGFYTCASGGLGHGLPAAIGVALARRDERIIALLGDGSSLYAIQGLWTAAQLGLPMTFIIIYNGGYAALSHFARHFAIDRTYGTEIGGMDFVGIAQAQGLEARRAASAAELEELLPAALASSRTNLIEILVEH